MTPNAETFLRFARYLLARAAECELTDAKRADVFGRDAINAIEAAIITDTTP